MKVLQFNPSPCAVSLLTHSRSRSSLVPRPLLPHQHPRVSASASRKCSFPSPLPCIILYPYIYTYTASPRRPQSLSPPKPPSQQLLTAPPLLAHAAREDVAVAEAARVAPRPRLLRNSTLTWQTTSNPVGGRRQNLTTCRVLYRPSAERFDCLPQCCLLAVPWPCSKHLCSLTDPPRTPFLGGSPSV